MVKRGMLLLVALVALVAVPGRAQFGSIEGDVKDPDGKAMVGAQIIIERLDIKGTYKVKSDKKGHYFHGGLPLGRYTVTLMQGDQKLDMVQNVRVSLGEPTVVHFDLKVARDRQLAAQAGIQLRQQPGQDTAQLTKEQRAQIETQLKQRESQRQKQEKLQKSFNVGVEELKATKDNQVLLARANIQLQPGQQLTPEQQRAALEEQRARAFDNAIKEFQAAADADPTQHVVFAQLAEAYAGSARGKRGEEAQAVYAKAIEVYQKALSLKPDDASYHNNYALALVSAGKMQEGMDELNKAAQLDPANAGQYYFNLGAVLTNAGKGKEATEAFRKATQVNPNYAEAWYQLGVSLLSEAKLDEKTGTTTPAPGTVEALQKYLELQPSGSHAAEAKGIIDTLGTVVQTEIKTPKPARKR